MQCPRCGTPVPDASAACSECGWLVTDAAQATVSIAVAELSEPERRVVAQAEEPDFLLQQLRKDLAGDYEVEGMLGRGGMAVVYKATEIELHRTVALKVLPPGTGGATMAERFKREARMAAALDHPNIIPVHRVGQAAGTFYFAMKFVEGRALDAVIESQGALPIPVVLQVLRCTTGALSFAHERGIIHRDIKGANILIDRDGRVLVSDFGIARAAEEKTLTASGSVIGTPHFMSPEQCSGAKVAPQTDQYAVGVLAFQMLTGSVPFDADSLMAILQHHFFSPVPDLTAVRDGVPDGLVGIVNKALAKDPNLRFPTTAVMLAQIEAIPFGDTDRRDAEELLKQLARGTAIPRVRTGSLPPLQDTRIAGMRAAMTARTATAAKAARVSAPRPAPPPPKRTRVRAVVGTLVVVAVLGGGAAAVVLRRGGGAPPVDSAAIRVSPLVQPPALTQQAESIAAAARADSVARADSARRESAAVAAAPGRAPARQRRAPVRQEVAPQQPRAQPQVVPAQPAAPRATGLIRLRSEPPDAQIFLDGRPVAQGVLFDHEASAGPHRVRITAPGCQTLEFPIEVPPNGSASLGTRRLTCP